jgi:hypothetical protein
MSVMALPLAPFFANGFPWLLDFNIFSGKFLDHSGGPILHFGRRFHLGKPG